MISLSTKNLMIEVEKIYTVKFTENQAKELYEFLREAKDFGHLHTDKDLILIYNELRKLFDGEVR